jgi:hypothetical protein
MERALCSFRTWSPPVTTHPDIPTAVPFPGASHPDGMGPWPGDKGAVYPHPAALPDPVSRGPDITGPGRRRDDLDSWRRRRGRGDDHHRGRRRRVNNLRWGGRRWRRLVIDGLGRVNRHIRDVMFHAAGGQGRHTHQQDRSNVSSVFHNSFSPLLRLLVRRLRPKHVAEKMVKNERIGLKFSRGESSKWLPKKTGRSGGRGSCRGMGAGRREVPQERRPAG